MEDLKPAELRRALDDAGKADGFSNPQISVGAALRPVLLELERRLGGGPKD